MDVDMCLLKYILRLRILLFGLAIMLRYSLCLGFMFQGNNLETNLELANKVSNIQDRIDNFYKPIWDVKDGFSAEPINLQLRYYSEYIDLLGKLALNNSMSKNEKTEYYIAIRSIGMFAADIINHSDTTAINYKMIEIK